MARIKAWLLVTRYTVRDYLDTVVLLEKLGEPAARAALESLDRLYPQASGASVLAELGERLAAGEPQDRAAVELSSYRGLIAPWNDWSRLLAAGRRWSEVVATLVLRSSGEDGHA
jgi:hypothetical protein